jgi:hypothetical protein
MPLIFGTASILFILLAVSVGLVMMLIVRSLNGKELKVTPTSFVMLLLVPLIIGTGLMALGSFLEVHEEPELCGEYCHAMGPFYDSYNNPGNNTLLSGHSERGVTCLDCHTGPGWKGQIDVWLAVPNEAYLEVTDGYDLEEMKGHVPPLFCLKCHDGGVAPIPGNVTTRIGISVNPHDEGRPCSECHIAHERGLGQTTTACAVCHGTEYEDFNESLENHGITTGAHCMDCHDRLHPDDAKVPFSVSPDEMNVTFCSDCHKHEIHALNLTTHPLAEELYGECTHCHIEHAPSIPIHNQSGPYEDCISCHKSIELHGGIHNRSIISYLDVPGIEGDFCWGCHQEETEGLQANPVHLELDCTWCHSDHRLLVEFEECNVCHEGDIPSWHETGMGSCTRSACHGTGFYH